MKSDSQPIVSNWVYRVYVWSYRPLHPFTCHKLYAHPALQSLSILVLWWKGLSCKRRLSDHLQNNSPQFTQDWPWGNHRDQAQNSPFISETTVKFILRSSIYPNCGEDLEVSKYRRVGRICLESAKIKAMMERVLTVPVCLLHVNVSVSGISGAHWKCQGWHRELNNLWGWKGKAPVVPSVAMDDSCCLITHSPSICLYIYSLLAFIHCARFCMESSVMGDNMMIGSRKFGRLIHQKFHFSMLICGVVRECMSDKIQNSFSKYILTIAAHDCDPSLLTRGWWEGMTLSWLCAVLALLEDIFLSSKDPHPYQLGRS